jgi:hypothetical protein
MEDEVVVASVLLCPKQAATFLGVSVATLATWRVRRSGPRFARVGRSVRYELQVLEEWVSARSVDPIADE